MDDNPYASPEDGEDDEHDDSEAVEVKENEDTQDAEPTLPAHQVSARLCILFVALVCGAMAAVMVVAFFVNLTFTYPGTNQSVIAVAPLWLAGRALFGIGFGVLTWSLVRYQSAIKRWDSPQAVGAEEFLDVHTRFWRSVAQVLFVFAGYAIISMAFASIDFAS